MGAAPAAAPAPVAAPGEVERRELTSIRKTIARRLTEAWQIPVFQLQVSVDMTRANELVARLREHEEGPKATVTDVLTKVCAAGLLRHREVNAQYTDDAILLFPTANIGIAVAAPQGLVVPGDPRRRATPPDRDRRRPRGHRLAARARASSSAATSRTAPSRSRTSACTASSASPPC